MSQINEKSLEQAARALVDHTPGLVGYGSMTLSITTPQALVAISAFLQAEAARGFQMMKLSDYERLAYVAATFRTFVDQIQGNEVLLIELGAELKAAADMFDAADGGGADV